MDLHTREIKNEISNRELPSLEEIQAQREALNLGLGGRVLPNIFLPDQAIRDGEKVMCDAATKAYWQKAFVNFHARDDVQRSVAPFTINF
ncbi:hypothetical protein E3N88_34468 [Mikania micrantha]|uniref:Uncharacterized protein n=1 Tax=Mikania micrantha TaxID=192012 RepID=A0A5N6LYD1_9ASTR|nr:hypothetical protein E3N88_34468 [Mikania micrantha]